MNVYDCFGAFNLSTKSFNLAVQTTNIGLDEFYISKYYNICSPTRFAIVAILQTKDKNATDMTGWKPDSGLLKTDIKFSALSAKFLTSNDKDIATVSNGDEIAVYTLHAIGFDENDQDDIQNILDRKADNLLILTKGSPPSVGGKGILT
ncbi:hypothetical protein [Flavobacterium sp.]|uniref:hypothetical protein n=1 Tax=Flavobacterium sp. TaxID=239 RepID=UPI0025D41FF8|nr:hypothetical protein [Flavobacterium sp.]